VTSSLSSLPPLPQTRSSPALPTWYVLSLVRTSTSINLHGQQLETADKSLLIERKIRVNWLAAGSDANQAPNRPMSTPNKQAIANGVSSSTYIIDLVTNCIPRPTILQTSPAHILPPAPETTLPPRHLPLTTPLRSPPTKRRGPSLHMRRPRARLARLQQPSRRLPR
jgi:hypothetical protein